MKSVLRTVILLGRTVSRATLIAVASSSSVIELCPLRIASRRQSLTSCFTTLAAYSGAGSRSVVGEPSIV